MGTPAGRGVDALDEDHAVAFHRFLAQRQTVALLADEVARHDGQVAPYALVGGGLGTAQRGVIQLGDRDVEIDGARPLAEVERARRRAVDPLERRREQVLPVMLLHVVEAPGPVDAPFHFGAGLEGPVEEVQHVAFRLLHVQDLRASEGAAIPGLAAAFRIEGGSVEQGRRLSALLGAADYTGSETDEIGIGQIQALGHRCSAPSGAPPVAGKARSSGRRAL